MWPILVVVDTVVLAGSITIAPLFYNPESALDKLHFCLINAIAQNVVEGLASDEQKLTNFGLLDLGKDLVTGNNLPPACSTGVM